MVEFKGCSDRADFDEHIVMFQLNPFLASLERQVSLAERRQRVIGNNIANVNTPGFHTLELVVDNRTLEGSAASGQLRQDAAIREQTGLPVREDGNNVDIDAQVVESNKNMILYQTYLQLLAGQFNQLRQAIRT